jgi:aminoglycoside phosphotransferase (APT) family kinase protein
MHPDEIHITKDLARTLLVTHCPQWQHPSLEPAPLSGTDHTMFRLGTDMALRFPRRPSAVLQVLKEQQFLPAISASLTIDTPTPVKAMRPCDLFGYPWSVCQWIEGHTLRRTPDFVEIDFVHDIGLFLADLKSAQVGNVPLPGPHNFGRGVALQERDAQTRAAIAAIADEFDTAALLRGWSKALAAKPYEGPLRLIHGDLAASNILIKDERLSGVIDWGGLAVGDPACDLMLAWNFLEEPWRGLFRIASGANNDDWQRGLGWALSVAAIQLPYYRDTSPTIATAARATLTAVLSAQS